MAKCSADALRATGTALRVAAPQVNCGDTGEGGRCGALGREREALYGYGERRCVSFTGLRSAFQERNALGMNPRQGG